MSYFLLAILVLYGKKQVILALSLSWLFTMLNPVLAPSPLLGSIGRYVVLFAATLSVVLKSGAARKQRNRFAQWTFLLGVFISMHAVIISPFPDVSVLKAVSWTMAMVTLIVAWSGLSAHESAEMQQWVYGLLLAVLFLSLPFLLIPSVGYQRNGSGFQGILNHPQVFGATMSMLGALILGRLLREKRPSWRGISLLLLVFFVILKSEARTAGLALIIGGGTSALIGPYFCGGSLKSLMPALRSRRAVMLAGFGLVLLVAFAAQFRATFNEYLSKSGRSEATGVVAAYEVSRGVLMAPMVANIQDHLLTGIGFGVASFPDAMYVERDPVFGLPIGASIEKGVVPLMVLEELGLFGFLMVLLWVIALFRRAGAGGIPMLLVVLDVLLLNMGEATLFSAGGLGLITFILLAAASASPKREIGYCA